MCPRMSRAIFRPSIAIRTGFYATVRSSLCVIAYNTELVKRDDAPKSFADLLDPKWKGKIVKAHPSYSGTIMTSTYQMVRELGWPYLEKLSKQNVMQVQSATDTPKKIVLGERPVMADGNESNVLLLKEAGKPIEGGLCQRKARPPSCSRRRSLPPRRIPMPRGCSRTICSRPRRSSCSSTPAACARCMRWSRTSPAARRLSAIKVWKDDPAAVEAQGDEIKRRYSQYFRV